jgi:antitoxin ParD1/3/4
MPRQSITFTEPNDRWLTSQVDSQEYSSKSELINDLIRKARKDSEERKLIKAKLLEGENSGFSKQTKEEILHEFKRELGIDG